MIRKLILVISVAMIIIILCLGGLSNRLFLMKIATGICLLLILLWIYKLTGHRAIKFILKASLVGCCMFSGVYIFALIWPAAELWNYIDKNPQTRTHDSQ